ncbi:hypothetical protein [Arthrobacter sp. CP30]
MDPVFAVAFGTVFDAAFEAAAGLDGAAVRREVVRVEVLPALVFSAAADTFGVVLQEAARDCAGLALAVRWVGAAFLALAPLGVDRVAAAGM